jgi:hypothetical protein
MIKTDKTPTELDVMATQFFSDTEKKLGISAKLTQCINDYVAARDTPAVTLFQLFQTHLKNIITGRPFVLENLIVELRPAYDLLLLARLALHQPPITAQERKTIVSNLNSEIFKVFNYTGFTNNATGKWATEHAKKLGMEVCPYCNMQYTFTLRKRRPSTLQKGTKWGRTRPQFDHFISKGEHPYFALSFYNLIPSCYVCNANLKNTDQFLPSTHIHPFCEDTEDCLVFRTNVNKTDFLAGKTGFDISMELPANGDPIKHRRAQLNAQTFALNDLYGFHKTFAGEIIHKAYVYTDTQIKELLTEYGKNLGVSLYTSEKEILELLFGRYIHAHTLGKRSLAKLTRNILQELNIPI